MCCYKDYKNFERLNNLVQLVLHRAISFIESLPRDCQTSSYSAGSLMSADDATPVGVKMPMTPPTRDDDVDVDVTSVDATDGDSGTVGNAAKKTPGDDVSAAEKQPQQSIPLSVAELTDDASSVDQSIKPHAASSESAANNDGGDTEEWSVEEKERLFQFIGKIFTPSFPLYFAYKHCIHSSLEDLSKQDACALNNYCELSVRIALNFVCVDNPKATTQLCVSDYVTIWKKTVDFCSVVSVHLVVLGRLPKPEPKPRFFLNTEPKRNRGFRRPNGRFSFGGSAYMVLVTVRVFVTGL